MRSLIISRRWVIALLAAVVVAVPAMVVSSARAAHIAPRAAAAASPIKHVVVLYLENQSFDSVLGFWCDHHPARCPDGGMPHTVKLANGASVTPSDDPDVVPVVGHKVIDQKEAMDRGKMDGWYRIGGCKPPKYTCISGYKPSQEPNATALASRFTISDKFFSLADSPSFGGHLDIVTSSLDGFLGNLPRRVPGVKTGHGWGCDSDTAAPWSAGPGQPRKSVPACIPDPSLKVPNGGAFRPTPVAFKPTIMDELSKAHDSWKLYTGTCTDELTQPNGLLFCRQSTGGYLWAMCPVIAQCLYTQSATHTEPTPKVVSDAANGNLPAFSIVTPGGPESEHNGFSMTAGDDFVGKVAKAIMNGPQWHSTVLFITWDDCGCFYDQVPPPAAPDGKQEGPRLPLVMVSPYARPAHTDTTSSSLASILAFTEHNFGLPALGVNDAQANDLSGAFNYHQAPLKPIRMVNRPVPRGDHIIWSQGKQDT